MRRLAALLFLLALPLSVHAESVTTWNFAGGGGMGDWFLKGVTATPVAEGVHLQAQPQGGMTRETAPAHPIDVIRVTVANARPANAIFFWHKRGTPEGELLQVPIQIGQDGPSHTIETDMTKYAPWDPKTDRMGFIFPDGAEFTLVSMDLVGYSLWEKAVEGVRSFWTFDVLQAYSVNFLWGPLLNFNPVARRATFASAPAIGWSANRLFYLSLAVTAVAALAWRFWRKQTRGPLLLFCGVFAGLWILYDVRMGSEILSYALTDYRSYIAQPEGSRMLRGYLNFHDALERSMPALTEDPRYVFVGPAKTPLLNMARYRTYPQSVPLFPDEDVAGIRTWFVFYRPDVTVGTGGQLMQSGQAVSPPGTVLERFDPQSFLFRVD